MADPEVHVGGRGPADGGDVEMQGGDDRPEAIEIGDTVEDDAGEEGEPTEEEKPAQRVTFVE